MKDIKIIMDQNVSNEKKEVRGVGYLFSLMLNQKKAEDNSEYLASLRQKSLLSVEEAAELYGVGRKKIRDLTQDDNCPFVLWIGGHRKIKREAFEKYILDQFSV